MLRRRIRDTTALYVPERLVRINVLRDVTTFILPSSAADGTACDVTLSGVDREGVSDPVARIHEPKNSKVSNG